MTGRLREHRPADFVCQTDALRIDTIVVGIGP
jgi:hypothetical protein